MSGGRCTARWQFSERQFERMIAALSPTTTSDDTPFWGCWFLLVVDDLRWHKCEESRGVAIADQRLLPVAAEDGILDLAFQRRGSDSRSSILTLQLCDEGGVEKFL